MEKNLREIIKGLEDRGWSLGSDLLTMVKEDEVDIYLDSKEHPWVSDDSSGLKFDSGLSQSDTTHEVLGIEILIWLTKVSVVFPTENPSRETILHELFHAWNNLKGDTRFWWLWSKDCEEDVKGSLAMYIDLLSRGAGTTYAWTRSFVNYGGYTTSDGLSPALLGAVAQLCKELGIRVPGFNGVKGPLDE